jgi:hypothetical protein
MAPLGTLQTSQHTRHNPPTLECIMNLIKHMEAIFFAAAAVAVSAAFVTTDTPTLIVSADRPLFIHPDAHVPVVTVPAKRLSPAEKSALI